MDSKFVFLAASILFVSGCISSPESSENLFNNESDTISPIMPEQSPKAAAQKYVERTYHNTQTVIFSEFSYVVQNISDIEALVNIKFKRVLQTPNYDLIRIMEQTVTAEKRNGVWVVTDTPNARIVSETYDYKR